MSVELKGQITGMSLNKQGISVSIMAETENSELCDTLKDLIGKTLDVEITETQ